MAPSKKTSISKESRHDSASPKAKADRIRYLRNSLRYSRRQFATKHGISYETLCNWERPKYTGLTENGAMMLVDAFNSEGVACTKDWLMYGIEQGSVQQASHSANTIIEELRVFLQKNPGAVEIIMTDDGMAPCFLPGDHVAGIRHFEDDLEETLGLSCIVQTAAGEILVRKIIAGNRSGLYTLQCVNPDTTVNVPVLEDVTIISAAPVVWFRRPI